MYFIWKGTESIKWLEKFAAPILILIGILLIAWGATKAGGFGLVLEEGRQLEKPTASLTQKEGQLYVTLTPIENKDASIRASEYQISYINQEDTLHLDWHTFTRENAIVSLEGLTDKPIKEQIITGEQRVYIQFRAKTTNDYLTSSIIHVPYQNTNTSFREKIWTYLLWLTAMVGFWATMSLSIADITRYANSQKEQVKGQFIGLPGTMILYSFVGIFVTYAAVVNFNDILIAEDAPWDPVALLARFENPVLNIVSQFFMLIATLSTNIAANVIAPANAFSNLLPKQVSFKQGGYITGVIGILICPWWLMNEIFGILIFISGLLGPVLGILIGDYFLVRKKEIQLAELYKTNGIYAYGGSGFNSAAMIALACGVLTALIGYWIPALDFLYKLSWFTGFTVALVLYYFLMKKKAS